MAVLGLGGMGGGVVETEMAALIPPHYSTSSTPAGLEPANTGVDKYHRILTHLLTHALSGCLVMLYHSWTRTLCCTDTCWLA